jgi:esterase/lipase
MGSPKGGFRLFGPDHLHHELGLNLLLPILPIHGPRRVGLVSGDRILSGDGMDSLHAGAQAVWDIRRMIQHLKDSEASPRIGILGESLGGYVAALLASLDDNLDCVAVCNPAVDPSRLFWSNALSITSHQLRKNGVTEEKMSETLRPVSPLALAPLVPKANRAIFAGVADRVVTAAEANILWHHWDEPRIEWFQGTHRGFLSTPQGRTLLAETLANAGILVKS